MLTANLTYARGLADDPTPDDPHSGDEVPATWKPWASTFRTDLGQDGFPVHPSPWLTDIAFDGPNMVLGIRDRFGDQGGFMTGNTAAGSEDEFSVVAAGDILRAAPGGAGWVLESNGTSGGVTTAGAGNGQGPGGGEFYFQDGSTDPVPQDVATGGLAQVAGFGTIAATGNDPSAAFTGGIYTFANASAAPGLNPTPVSAGVASTSGALYESFDLNTFGSANGLGDLAVLPADGTVQAGDRVFADANANGRQDAGEAGIAGVVLRLFQAGTQVDSVTAGAGGDYLFDGLVPNTAYEVRIDTTQAALAGRTLATANQGADDQLDSDATLTGTTAAMAFTTADAGTSVHSLDAGFTGGGTTTTPTLTLGNLVFRDANNNGTFDSGETGVAAVAVDLLNADGTAVLQSTTTAAGGTYSFAGLAAGTYRVRLAAANFTRAGPLVGFTSSTASSNNPDDNVNNNDDGVASGALGGGGTVQSGPITLAVGGEPTTDGDSDANTNLTLDFGVVPPTGTLTLGNQVFNDVNGNGVLDTPEAGISGVSVQLVDAQGNVLQSTTTAAGGLYAFAGLAPGDYKVRLAATNFNAGGPLANFTSPGAKSADPDDNANSVNDGTAVGLLGAGGFVESGPITLTANGEPTTDGGTDATTNLTLDFGLVAKAANTVALGDRVFKDANNNGLLDTGETGLAGATVQLLDAAGTVLRTTTTDTGGTYGFSGLAAGTYKVRLPAADFQTGGPLVGFRPSAAKSSNPNDNVKGNNDGATVGTLGSATGTVDTGLVTLAAGTEPTTDGDTDANSNRTIDFALTQAAAGTLSLGGTVWADANNNGTLDSGETGVAGATVQLLDGSGAVLNTTATGTDGTYSFAALAAGDYKVRLPSTDFTGTGPLVGFTSSTGTNGALTGSFEGAATPDPDTGADGDDNGTATGTLGTSSGFVETALVTLAASTHDGRPRRVQEAEPRQHGLQRPEQQRHPGRRRAGDRQRLRPPLERGRQLRPGRHDDNERPGPIPVHEPAAG